MSALSNLAGFYPPKSKQIWNADIPWQPIPVHTIPEKLDDILAAKKPCATYDYELKKVKRSTEFRNLDKQLKGLYEYLTVNTGKNVTSIDSVSIIYNELFIEKLYNFT